LLDVNDTAMGKLVRCPACTLTFVASPALAGASAKPGAPASAGGAAQSADPDGYELEGEAQGTPQGTGIGEPKFCPNCGKLWPSGKPRCGNCRYDLLLGRVALLERKLRLPKIDMQSLYVSLALGALAAGAYFVFRYWNTLYSSLNSLWR